MHHNKENNSRPTTWRLVQNKSWLLVEYGNMLDLDGFKSLQDVINFYVNYHHNVADGLL